MLGEMGYLGAPVAEEYGGRGLDYVSYGLIVEQIGRGDSAARTVVSVQTSLVCGSIERWGTEEQKQRWLPRLCSGEALGCFGLTEPDTGSDAASLRTRAETDGRRLGAQRPEDVDLARQLRRGRADLRPDRARVGSEGPGLLPGPDRGRRASRPRRSTASSGCARPIRRRSRSTAWRSQRTRCSARSARASRSRCRRSTRAATRSPPGASGICDGCVDASVSYSTERKQFGVPLARFQLVQELIADMIVKRDAARHARLARRDRSRTRERPRRSRPRSRSSTPPSRPSSARTRRSRCTAARVTSTTIRSSATCATPGSRRCTRGPRRSRS